MRKPTVNDIVKMMDACSLTDAAVATVDHGMDKDKIAAAYTSSAEDLGDGGWWTRSTIELYFSLIQSELDKPAYTEKWIERFSDPSRRTGIIWYAIGENMQWGATTPSGINAKDPRVEALLKIAAADYMVSPRHQKGKK